MTAMGDPMDYPPPPWHSHGQMWIGLLKAMEPAATPPAGLKVALRSDWLLVFLVRYLEGTLRYDELAIGRLMQRQWRIGFLTQYIWVDSVPSLQGGRRIWGVPKELAKFNWDGDTVRVEDDGGVLVEMTVNRTNARSMKLPLVAPAFGLLDDQLVAFQARMRASLRASSMRLCQWSPRLPPVHLEPIMGIDACPMEISVGAPKLISRTLDVGAHTREAES